MSDNMSLTPVGTLQNMIFTFRGVQVMIDKDLATLYQVENKRLNEQVKRNSNRFPEEFRFQLNAKEKMELVANCDRFKYLKHSSVNPYAFTEQGVSMLSAVLRSETAVKVSIQIIQAFVEMRRFIQNNAQVFQRLDSVERRQIALETNTEEKFERGGGNELSSRSIEVKFTIAGGRPGSRITLSLSFPLVMKKLLSQQSIVSIAKSVCSNRK